MTFIIRNKLIFLLDYLGQEYFLTMVDSFYYRCSRLRALVLQDHLSLIGLFALWHFLMQREYFLWNVVFLTFICESLLMIWIFRLSQNLLRNMLIHLLSHLLLHIYYQAWGHNECSLLSVSLLMHQELVIQLLLQAIWVRFLLAYYQIHLG